MQYEDTTTEPKVIEMIGALLVLAFLIFGLWIIGIVWGVHEFDKANAEAKANQSNSIVIPGATTEDLPLQHTINGADLQGSSPCLQGTCE